MLEIQFIVRDPEQEQEHEFVLEGIEAHENPLVPVLEFLETEFSAFDVEMDGNMIRTESNLFAEIV